MQRYFDILLSAIGLLLLSPLFLIIAILIKIDSRGPVFFHQQRVGKNGAFFKIMKFRTMYRDANKRGLLTVGNRDPRVTKVGYVLRKNKLDELPQLINVLKGEMSLVGPRPEVPKYVELYNEEQRKVLKVRPGITDMASIEFSNENEILANYPDPEKAYIEIVMPAKLALNMEYIRNYTLRNYFVLLWLTARKLFANN